MWRWKSGKAERRKGGKAERRKGGKAERIREQRKGVKKKGGALRDGKGHAAPCYGPLREPSPATPSPDTKRPGRVPSGPAGGLVWGGKMGKVPECLQESGRGLFSRKSALLWLRL